MASHTVIKHRQDGEWLNVLGMRVKFLCTSEDTQGRYSSLLNTVPKDLGAPPHKHPWDEAFYVLKGEVELQVGDERHHLSEGDYVLVPANTVHAFKGLSDEEGLLIAFESPSHSHRFFQEIHDCIKVMPDDLEKVLAIGERHKVTMLN